MKLDIGSGGKAPDGYLSHDFREETAPDVVCDAREFPPRYQGFFEEVRASNILEHFNRFQQKEVLSHWASLVAPGGKLVVIVPDMLEISRQLVLGYIDASTFSYLTYGGHDYVGNEHAYGFSPESLRQCFEEAGLSSVSVVPGKRFEDKGPDLYCPMIVAEGLRL